MARLRHHEPQLIDAGDWPAERTGPRVVVEHPDGAVRWSLVELLREAGYEVAACAGPGEDGRDERCPLLERGACALVDGADVVVSTCDLAESHGILAALEAPGRPPVVFEVPRPRDGEFADAAPGTTRVYAPLLPSDVLRAVADALQSTSIASPNE